MDALLRADRLSLVAALGAGVVVGISGIYYYYKVNKCVTRKLNNLTNSIDVLRRELEELKSSNVSRKERPPKSPIKKVNVNSSTPGSSKYYSYTSSLDDPDEEYFDFTDTEDVTGIWSSLHGSQEDICIDKESNFLDELDVLLDSDIADKELVYKRMCDKKDEFEQNAGFLWRFAKATHLYGIVVQNRNELERRKHLAFEASKYAESAYELDKENPEVLKWCAITIGSLGDYVGVHEKIKNGFVFKEYVDKAIALKPLDPSLHYMLGRWCYEVATISWLERKVATSLFSMLPEASLDDARSYLLEADKIKPNWKENLLFLAKTHIGEGNYANAISIIDKALSIPVTTEDDDIAHNELTALEYKYQSYRAS